MSTPHPPLRPFGRVAVAAPTGAESEAFDRRAIDTIGVPQAVLMENAGRSAAAVLCRLFPEGPVLALVGSGNNGGDALVAARSLRSWGREVTTVLVGGRLPSDPLLHGWDLAPLAEEGLDGDAWSRLLAGAGVVVDGLLGTGARGAPRERHAAVIGRVNAAGRPVLAMDVPSGVDASSGRIPGDAVRARATVGFGAPKLGTLLHPGRAYSGRVVAVDIGFPPWRPIDARAWVATPAWVSTRLPVRTPDVHKNRVGRVLVVAGGPGMAGAAVLTVRASFAAGAGYVRVCTLPANREVLQAAVPEAVWVDATDAGAVAAAAEASDAVAAGPGLGIDAPATELLAGVLTGPARPTALDADALNLVAAGALDAGAVARERPLLLTPHPGEMARLLASDTGEVAANPPAAAREAATRFGCAALLKGAPSLVAEPDGTVWVDTQGSSDLAVAGMGDALTGVVGTLLAQGLPPAEAGSVALHMTGRAARLAGRGVSLTPSDVVRWLPDAFREGGRGAGEAELPFVVYDADPAR